MRIFSKPIRYLTLAAFSLGLTHCGGDSPLDELNPLADGDSGGGSDGFDETAIADLDSSTGASNVPDDLMKFAGALNLIPPKKAGATTLALLEGEDEDNGVRIELDEPSLDALGQVKGIHCFIGATTFWEFLNKGPYIALIDEGKCFDDGEGDSKGQKSFMKIIVDATRNPNEVAKVKIWFSEDGNGPGTVTASIASGPNPLTKNPLGVFDIAWGKADNGGFLQVFQKEGKIIVNYGESNIWDEGDRGKGEQKNRMAAELAKIDGELEGKFSVDYSMKQERQDGNFEESGSFKVAYDADFVRRGSSEGDACLDRNSYTESVRNYRAFNSDGSVVKLNTGFPFVFEKDGRKLQGNFGYHGLWFEGGELEDGATIHRISWEDDNVKEPHTIVVRPAKLRLRDPKKIDLAKLEGVKLNFHGNDGKQYIVVYNGTKFEKVATQKCEDGPCKEEAMTPEDHSIQYGGHFHANGLGNVQIEVDGESSLGTAVTKVVVTPEKDVSTSAGDLTLYCYEQCPKAGLTAADMTWENAYLEIPESGYVTYTWSAAGKVLQQGGVDVVFPKDTSKDGQFGWGMNLDLVASGDAAGIDRYKVRGSKHYSLNFGNDHWNLLYLAKKADGSYATFDAPIEVGYTHTTANDRNGSDEFDGSFSYISINGDHIWGLPETRTEDGEFSYLFSMVDGAKSDDGAYFFSARELSQKPNDADSASCADLDNTEVPDLPDFGLVTNEDIGPAPTPKVEKPSVIDGEVQ